VYKRQNDHTFTTSAWNTFVYAKLMQILSSSTIQDAIERTLIFDCIQPPHYLIYFFDYFYI